MILLVHLLFGAAIGSAVKNIYLAVILAFLGHYFLDLIPHIDYPIENIKEKQWSRALPQIVLVALDFFAGIWLIFLFSKNQPIIYICALFALLPDGVTVLNFLMPNKTLQPFQKFHQKIHFLKDKKISNFWRIFTQVIIVIISMILLNRY